jgi:hypothetical protein
MLLKQQYAAKAAFLSRGGYLQQQVKLGADANTTLASNTVHFVQWGSHYCLPPRFRAARPARKPAPQGELY